MGATLKLKVPIFIARQIQRHRTFSYNEISRRYVDSPPEFFWPDKWRKRADNVKQGSSDEEVDVMQGLATDSYFPVQQVMEAQLKAAVNTYNDALAAGIAPELARMVLPQNMYTEFYMTGNLRAWEHFLKLRLDGHAQYEVQEVAQMVYQILQPLFPERVKALMEN
jgi:thymidylate synthase (FAD)